MFWITITWSVTGKHNAFEAKIVSKNSPICITATTFKIIKTLMPKNTHFPSPSSLIFLKRTRLDENHFSRSHTQWTTGCFFLAQARNEVVRISPLLKAFFVPTHRLSKNSTDLTEKADCKQSSFYLIFILVKVFVFYHWRKESSLYHYILS